MGTARSRRSWGLWRVDEGKGMYFGSFATSDESLLKFEMLNPTLYLWPSIYQYVESVDRLGESIEVTEEERDG